MNRRDTTNQASETRVPRASIAVSILRDPDVKTLLTTERGRKAVLVFFLLIIAAKEQRNGGKFKEPLAVVGELIGHSARNIQDSVAEIARVCKGNRHRPFIILKSGVLTIRQYAKWNSGWGGAREGSGRKSSCNQDVIKMCASESVMDSEAESVSVPDTEDSSPPNPPPGWLAGEERALRGAGADEADPDAARRLSRAWALLQTCGIAAKNFQLAWERLQTLPNPLGKLSEIVDRAKSAGKAGDTLAGYVYNAIEDEAKAVMVA